MSRILMVLVSIAVCGVSTLSQTNDGYIAGRIAERSTGQGVAAKVSVASGVQTRGDDQGNFRLAVPPGVYSVRITADGFAPIALNQIVVTGGRDTVINLRMDISLTGDVEVRSEIFAQNGEQTVSNVTLRREDLRTTPGTGGDPLRAINSLPAVSAASGEFADLIVRGGTADENLTYIDNIPVRDFTYFTDQYDGNRGGRAAILAPDVIDRAEFSAGGFGARYGDKLSSALDISLREANRRRVQGVLFADSGTAGGSLDIPLGKRGSWLVSARRSYIDVAFDLAGIAEQGIIGYPRTLDFTNKFVYDLTPRNKFAFTALNFFETFDQTDEQALNIDRRTDRFRSRRTSQRHVFGATVSSTIGSNALAQTTVFATGNHNDGTFFLPFSTFLQRSRDLRDSQSGIKEDVSVAISQTARILFGGSLYFDRANYHSFENSGRFYSPIEEEFLAPARENRLRLTSRTSAYAYAQAAVNLTKRLTITPGIRLDYYGLPGETLASPRFAARFNASEKLSLIFATGVYRQPPGLFAFSLTPNNKNLKTQTATHVIGGVDWLAREDIRVRFEAYRKTYENLITQPIGPTPAFVANGNFSNSGQATSRGFEISVQKSMTGFFSGQASYGFIRSRRSVTPGGLKFPSDFERPHQLTLIGSTRFYGFNVAAKYRVASGLPYTIRTAVEPFAGANAFIQRILLSSDVNASRLPKFASLDLRAEKRFSFKRLSFSPYIDIFNVTNHDSVVQPNYEFFSQAPQFLSENRRLPIFGFRLEF